MDAIVGMDGPGGPGSGNPIKLNFLAASDNILALDWKCASLVGYNPHRIPNLDAALKRGVWLSSEKDITTVGENESNCKCPNFKIVKNPSKTLQIMIPGWVNFIAKKFFEKTPRFNSKKCVRCGRCKQICPAHIIELSGKNKTANLTDKSKCLHCFCCHEICPEDAIKLKRF
jgi:ferredoxin